MRRALASPDAPEPAATSLALVAMGAAGDEPNAADFQGAPGTTVWLPRGELMYLIDEALAARSVFRTAVLSAGVYGGGGPPRPLQDLRGKPGLLWAIACYTLDAPSTEAASRLARVRNVIGAVQLKEAERDVYWGPGRGGDY